MSMRGFIAALVSAAIGMAQFLYIVYLDAMNEESFLPRGDGAYLLFSFTWLAEMVALIVIAMYRFAPWIARLLRDDWEVIRILRDKRRHVALVEWLSSTAILLRAAVRAFESGHISVAVLVGSAFAFVPFFLPPPRQPKPLE